MTDIRNLLWETARAEKKRALPILSFPAVQKLNTNVETLVKTPELMAQAMEIIARDTDTLAAVSLMDLSIEAEAFGAQVRFYPDEVPAIVGQLVSDEDEANALEVPDLTAGRALKCVEGMRLAKQRITDKPVLAGMIGPYSLAGRIMDVTEIMYACYDEPELVHGVLEKASAFLIEYIKAFRDAGANGVVMAEPLAGLLSPELSSEFSCAYVKKIAESVQSDDFAVIYHNCGNAVGSMIPEILSTGCMAYHFGNAVDMRDILPQIPADTVCMGNIDPAGQFRNGTPQSIREVTST